jgi:uncharacterized membrane protein
LPRNHLDKVADQLPAIGITAASLTLVFLGFLFASWESYPKVDKGSVRVKFRVRGWMAFAGIVFALLAVVFGFIGIARSHTIPCVDWAGVVCLGLWAILIAAQSVIALLDIK